MSQTILKSKIEQKYPNPKALTVIIGIRIDKQTNGTQSPKTDPLTYGHSYEHSCTFLLMNMRKRFF